MSDQLLDFIRSRKDRVPGVAVDWEKKKNAWVRSVENLYGSIHEMLYDSISSGDVTTRTFNLDVTEDFIGLYSIPALELRIGGERVEFRPKGITVIGAAGRVDVRGLNDTVMLLTSDLDLERGWSVVLRRSPRMQLAPLDRESLKDMLERVMLP